jgi:hypothetical protein
LREASFSGGKGRRLFLETLAQACERTDWQGYAYAGSRTLQEN